MVIRTRTNAIKKRGEAKDKERRKQAREKNLTKKRNRNRERKTKGDTTGTRKFPIVTSVIVILALIVKEIHCLCFPLWSVYSLLLFIFRLCELL